MEQTKTSPWWHVALLIIILLVIMTGFSYGIYKLDKYLSRKGTCSFVSFSPNTDLNLRISAGDGDLVQAGYINCTGGGPLWNAKKIVITNNGPGTFYIGPLINQPTPQELDVGSSLPTDISNIVPNVYYTSDSSDTNPNFTIVSE